VFGISDQTSAPAANVILQNDVIGSFTTAGVYLYPSNQSGNGSGTCTLTDCFIAMQGAPYGVYLDHISTKKPYTFTGTRISVTGDSYGVYGIFLDNNANQEGTLTSPIVTGLVNGTGIYVEEHAPTIKAATVNNCSYGIQLLGTQDPKILQSDSDVGSSLDSNYRGLYVSANGGTGNNKVQVYKVSMTNCTVGLYTDGSSKAAFTDVDIFGGSTGFTSKSSEVHTFRHGNILNFEQTGVSTSQSSGLDLGTVNDPGNNNIFKSNPTGTQSYVKIKPYIVGLPDIKAEMNWWGSDPPPSAEFSQGVDYQPAQISLVINSAPNVAMEAIPQKSVLMVRPNPFGLTLSLNFLGLPAGGPGKVEIFDISGRIIKVWQGNEMGTGQLAWNGRDEIGRVAPQGVYFIRARSGDWESTVKVIKLQ